MLERTFRALMIAHAVAAVLCVGSIFLSACSMMTPSGYEADWDPDNNFTTNQTWGTDSE
jgi:hypothetical protein